MSTETPKVTDTKIGRPAKYTEDYCEKIKIARCNGESIPRACAIIGIARSTYYEWIKTYPDFKHACELAEDLSLSWWEEVGKDGMLKNREIQAQLYNSMMDRQFGSVKVADASKTEINIGNMNVLQQLSTEELQHKIAEKLKALGIQSGTTYENE